MCCCSVFVLGVSMLTRLISWSSIVISVAIMQPWLSCLGCVIRLFSLAEKVMPQELKSFCLRDRGRLGNEGWQISLKIGTQSHYVDLCNMPKFQLQRHSFSRVLDISPSGVPRGWFSVQFWPLFNLSFRNVKLISDKNKTMFAMPYS